MVAIALRSRVKNSKRHEERLKEKLQILDFFSKRYVEQSENVVQSENKSTELEVISKTSTENSHITFQSTIPANFQYGGKLKD